MSRKAVGSGWKLEQLRSSLPSLQSLSLSQRKARVMQRLFAHTNWLELHEAPSSLISPQSLSPSLMKACGMHFPLPQENSVERQLRALVRAKTADPTRRRATARCILSVGRGETILLTEFD